MIRRTLRSAIRMLLPMPVRRAVAERLRSRRIPSLARRILAYDGPFAVDLFGRSIRMVHTHRWIEDALFWDGAAHGYEPATLAVWVRAAARSTCILDVGANTGLFALSAQAHQPKATVVAFEPVPEFCRTLIHNAELNAFPVAIRQMACADYEGSATLLMPPALGGNVYAATLDRAHADAHHPRTLIEVPVDVRRLDRELARIGAGNPDLAKIDAEGVDAAVLRGLGDLLAGVRTLIVEVQGDTVAEQLEPLLPGDRWLRYVLDDRTGPRRAHAIAEAAGHNMLFVHPDEAAALGL
jgi:FkbM family methyltransferase